MATEKVTIIEPGRGFVPIDFRELWRFRELLYFLAWRDVKVKYKQAAIGILWAVLRPVVTMVVFSVIFGRLAKLPSDGVPYPIFVFVGLLPWQYFAAVLGLSTSSVVGGGGMVQKIYFPRLLLPMSTAVAAFFDLVIASVVLGAIMIYYGVAVNWGLLLVPVLIFLTALNALAFGLWFAALNVKYRDIGQLVPFVIQIWMFATPVIYPSSLAGERYAWVLSFNPMGGVIEAFRSAVLGNMPIPWTMLGVSAAVGIAVFIAGLYYFRSVERYFADVI